MFKKSYQKLLCAAILVALLVASLVTVYALEENNVVKSGSGSYTLTLEFEGKDKVDVFSSIELFRKGELIEPVGNSYRSVQYVVEKGFGTTDLELVFTVRQNNYDIMSFKEKLASSSLVPEMYYENGYYKIKYNQLGVHLQGDKTYTVTTDYKTYRIELDTEGLPLGFSWKQENQTIYKNQAEYTYKDPNDVFLGVPADVPGFVFKGWKCSGQKGGEGTIFDQPANGKYWMLKDQLVYPTTGDTLYIKPIFEAGSYSVERHDYEFDVINNTGSTTGLYGGSALITKYNEIYREGDEYKQNPVDGMGGNAGQSPLDEGGYQLYAGYEPFYTYATEENVGKYYTRLDKIYTANANDNIVYRYYVPITYALEYVGDEGVVWGVNSPDTHRFNADTDIPAPRKDGYHFVGWDVKIGDTVVAEIDNYSLANDKTLTLLAYGLGFTAADTDKKITLVAKWTPMTFDVEFDWNFRDGDSNKTAEFNKDAYSIYTYDYGFVNGAVIVVPGTEMEPNLLIQNPVRRGYHFTGWTVMGKDGVLANLPVVDGVDTITVGLQYFGSTDGYEGERDGVIVLKANWTPKTYNVTLSGVDTTGKGQADYTANTLQAIFDAQFSPSGLVAPILEGHSFMGFADASGKLWIGVDSDGNPVALNEKWTLDADTVLYATWRVNKYDVNVSIDSDKADIYFNGVAYAGPYEYGMTLEIRIVVKEGMNYKITRWNGEYLETHLRDATFRYTVGVENNLTATLLEINPAISKIEVYYKNETLFLPDGDYKIYCNGTTITVTVKNSVYTINGETSTATSIALDNAFFGHTLRIEVAGVKDRYADGELEIELPARKQAPVFNKENENAWIHGYATSRDSIEIKMNPNLQALLDKLGDELEYSYVVLANDGKAPLEWLPLVMDEEGIVKIADLLYGTEYLVRIRVKATDTAPHGEIFSFELKTQHENYIKEQIRELENLKTGGEMVDSVLQDAITQIQEYLTKGGSISTVQTEVEAILQVLEERLALARVQDEQLEALKALYDALIASKEFDAAGESTLKAAYDAAVASIKGILENPEYESLQSRVDALNKIGAETQKTMKNVSVRYLYSEDQVHTLTVGGVGLPQGSKWTLTYADNYEEWQKAIETAIRTGNLVMDGKPISVDELKTLVLHAYAVMNLELPDQAVVDPTLGYTVRVLLPYSLRGRSVAVQAAYYKPSGELVLLDSERDGDYLVFHSNTSGVASFVILSDEEVDLTALIWALAIIALCQLLAISVFLGGRAKTRRAIKHRSVALPAVVPMALAVRFLPNNALLTVLILGSAVVLLQIVLMWLLLTSDLINRRKKRVKRYAPQQTNRETAEPINTVELPEEGNPFDAVQMNDELIETDTESTEELPETDGFEAPEFYEGEENAEESELLYEDGAELLAEGEPLYEDAEGENDAFDVFDEAEPEVSEDAESTDEQVFEDDFIEPAANPKYSLPDEEFDPFGTDAEVDASVEEVYETEEAYATEEAYEPEAEYAPEEAYATEEVYEDEAEYATEEVYEPETEYATEEEYAAEDAPVASWEYDGEGEEIFEPDAEQEPIAGEDGESWQEGTVWEMDEIAPDPEEEIIYDDYVTGDPTEPFEEEGEICGDPNPYEVESTDGEEEIRYTDDTEA